MTALRAIIGIVTSVVLTPVGLAVIWFGDGELRLNRIAGILLTLVGVFLLLMVVQTGHVSSIGLIVASLGVTVIGLLGLLIPDVAHSVESLLRGFSPQIVKPAGEWFAFGFVLAVGFVLLGIAISTWFAHRPTDVSSSPALRGVLSIVLAIVGVVVGLGFLTRTDVSFVVLGAAVLGVVAITGMVSSAGLYVTGALVLVIGMISFIFDSIALAIAHSDVVGGNGMEAGSQSSLEVGFVVALGALLLGSGVVVRAVRARAARRESKARDVAETERV
ncbi:MAG: hypothetical protein JWN80_1236 [Microbacteriaceae bacterium]|jgi:hypothetical protein|nr:hypothetical protein [Microbacteriaceae bacterium]